MFCRKITVPANTPTLLPTDVANRKSGKGDVLIHCETGAIRVGDDDVSQVTDGYPVNAGEDLVVSHNPSVKLYAHSTVTSDVIVGVTVGERPA